jgi:hypothetical protein
MKNGNYCICASERLLLQEGRRGEVILSAEMRVQRGVLLGILLL